MGVLRPNHSMPEPAQRRRLARWEGDSHEGWGGRPQRGQESERERHSESVKEKERAREHVRETGGSVYEREKQRAVRERAR